MCKTLILHKHCFNLKNVLIMLNCVNTIVKYYINGALFLKFGISGLFLLPFAVLLQFSLGGLVSGTAIPVIKLWCYESVDHNKRWKILKEMGIPDHLNCLLRNLYAGQEASVRPAHGTTDWFPIGKAVCQGCILSVQFRCSVVSNSLRPHELQHARPPCPSPTTGVHSDSHPSSQWCHSAI